MEKLRNLLEVISEEMKDLEENVGSPTAIIDLSMEISEKRDADIFLYSGSINHEGCELFIQSFKAQELKKNIVLIIATFGGDANSAYRMGRFLKNHYEKITFLIPSFCKSSGTLLALCADELVISSEGELGPLDIQVLKQEEFNERSSGLDLLQALDTLQIKSLDVFKDHFITFKLGSGLSTKQAIIVATDTTIGLLGPIYAQIEPLRLGEISRSMRIALEYGERLSRGNLHEGALSRLVSGYSSHGFVIDKEEAEELFINVNDPDNNEEELLQHLRKILLSQLSSATPTIIQLSPILTVNEVNKSARKEKINETKDEDKRNKPKRKQRAREKKSTKRTNSTSKT